MLLLFYTCFKQTISTGMEIQSLFLNSRQMFFNAALELQCEQQRQPTPDGGINSTAVLIDL